MALIGPVRLTQVALARGAGGISQADVSKIENGRMSYLGPARTQRLASALGITPDDLL